MMKHRTVLALALTLVLLFTSTAFSKQRYYTIAQVREQAPQVWQQSYTAHDREIVIHVAPQVPQADAFPMAELKRLPLSVSLPDEPGWFINPNTQRGMEEDPSYFFFSLGDDGVNTPSVIGGKKVKYGPHRIYYDYLFEPDGRYIPGSELTFEEITDILRQNLKKIGLADAIVNPERPSELNAHAYYGQSATEFLAPGWGFISYCQLLRGIPIYQHGLPSASDGENPGFSPHFSFNFHTPQDYNLGGILLSESRLLADDVPLAPFEQVQKALEAEIKAGRLRHIFALKLCYAIACPPGFGNQRDYYLNKDIPGYSVPVWVAEVLWAENPRKELSPAWEEPGGYEAPDARNSLSYRRLMVNAQTGKLYDPQSEDPNRGLYEGFLSWEDVGGK